MAIKTSEVRDLPTEEIAQKLNETREELFNLRFQLATGQLDNYRQIRSLRKDIARLRTILRERDIAETETETGEDR